MGGVSFLQPTTGVWESRKRILTYFEGHRTLAFLYLYDKNLRRTICISVPSSKFWGGDLYSPVPVIYAHEPTIFLSLFTCVNVLIGE